MILNSSTAKTFVSKRNVVEACRTVVSNGSLQEIIVLTLPIRGELFQIKLGGDVWSITSLYDRFDQSR